MDSIGISTRESVSILGAFDIGDRRCGEGIGPGSRIARHRKGFKPKPASGKE